jgi:tRNA 2-thiouridine synthesizing protein A
MMTMTTFSLPTQADHDIEWDAGELGCGDLVLALRQRVRQAPGKVFKVTAHDAGAQADIPAWCRMTNNVLVAHDPPSRVFWVRAKA